LGNLEGGGVIYHGLGDTLIFGLLFLDPEDVRSLSLGAFWNFSKGTRLSRLGIRVCGTEGLSKDPGALGPKGLKPNYYSALNCLVYFMDSEMPRPSAFIGSLHSVFYLWPLLWKAYMFTFLNEVYLITRLVAELH
jgi:hypothetical protein